MGCGGESSRSSWRAIRCARRGDLSFYTILASDGVASDQQATAPAAKNAKLNAEGPRHLLILEHFLTLSLKENRRTLRALDPRCRRCPLILTWSPFLSSISISQLGNSSFFPSLSLASIIMPYCCLSPDHLEHNLNLCSSDLMTHDNYCLAIMLILVLFQN